MMNVDHPDGFPAADQWYRKQRFVGVFEKLREFLEARIAEGVLVQGDDGFVLRHPTGNSFAGFDAQHADIVYVRRLGSAQHDLVGALIDQVNQAGIADGGLYREANDLTQFFIQGEI